MRGLTDDSSYIVPVFQRNGQLYRLHSGEIYYDRQWTVTY